MLRRLLCIRILYSKSEMFLSCGIPSFKKLAYFVNVFILMNVGKKGTGKKGTGKMGTEKRAQEKWAQEKRAQVKN